MSKVDPRNEIRATNINTLSLSGLIVRPNRLLQLLIRVRLSFETDTALVPKFVKP
jgi:hypothetical protein